MTDSTLSVSVVICTHTSEHLEHFHEAAESILQQTYDAVELVVVVDGNDNLYETLARHYQTHENVVLQCNEHNIGLLKSRNAGAAIASGEIVAFIDDDAIADRNWVSRLVECYDTRDVLAAGGQMTPVWVAGKPSFLPEEFYWLVGVTHRGFADGPGEVRNTFGSNISFRADVFDALGGFDPSMGGRQGDKNLQGGETELCARLADSYGKGVWYDPGATVGHKVFDYRTDVMWLLDRAFWQGYSKRVMGQRVEDGGDEECDYLKRLLVDFAPDKLGTALRSPSRESLSQFVMLIVLTATVGMGFLYAVAVTFDGLPGQTDRQPQPVDSR